MKNSPATSLTLCCLSAAAALFFAAPARAEAPAGSGQSDYHAVVLDKEGRADEAALEQVTAAVERDLQAGSGEIVVMVHGFAVTAKRGTEEFTDIAQRLRRKGEASGFRPSIVGVHWDSDAGSLRSWMLQATGQRLASLLGMKRAVRNPYLEKCRLATQTGRTGMRSLLLRLEERFPQAPVHVFSHSLGAEVVVSALVPEAGDPAMPVVEPDRPLQLGAVVLAGADLDHDRFSRNEDAVVRLALRRAQVWWVTVPGKGRADGALEMRHGAGKGDAVGNRGLALDRDDLNRLLSRRALVLDQSRIPAKHQVTTYFDDTRLAELTASLLYLRDPSAEAGKGSVLATLDRVLDGERPALAARDAADPCVKLYATWRMEPSRSEFGPFRVAERRDETPRARRLQDTIAPGLGSILAAAA